ncbi:Pvc16 family protein [Paraflavitalea speifideaquila]|uniref:Pvc16 family protein n=1 Tax=Paraflavitalea speifideaquila TaxID=3076558 RepID=UPI0028F168A3|nr:Pvc16 family protein [Paraflavitalea speifideiaquila]
MRHEGGYGKALEIVQNTIGFFQKKYVFDHANTSTLDPGIEKLILEMISLNLEQLHQLWSMLGGRYHPSVAYRMKMVTIDSITETDGSLVKEIQIIV